MYFLIAGYNTMPKEEKEKYNIQKIAGLFMRVMVLMACINFIGFYIHEYTSLGNGYDVPKTALMASVFIGMPLLFLANSKKYRKENS